MPADDIKGHSRSGWVVSTTIVALPDQEGRANGIGSNPIDSRATALKGYPSGPIEGVHVGPFLY